MTNKKTTAAPLPLWQYWRGLGGWNFYFLVKFALLWAGYLNFHPMLNLVFLAFLLVPIPREKLHRIRHWIAIPLGFALFWHDTWLPGPESIFSQGSQIAQLQRQLYLGSDCPLYQLEHGWRLLCFAGAMVVYQPVAARHRVCLGNGRLAGGQPAAADSLPYGPPVSPPRPPPRPHRPIPGPTPPLAPRPAPPTAIFRRRPSRRPQPT